MLVVLISMIEGGPLKVAARYDAGRASGLIEINAAGLPVARLRFLWSGAGGRAMFGRRCGRMPCLSADRSPTSRLDNARSRVERPIGGFRHSQLCTEFVLKWRARRDSNS
jgi:hypothetical protein